MWLFFFFLKKTIANIYNQCYNKNVSFKGRKIYNMKTNKILAIFILCVLIINLFIPNVILAKESIIEEEGNVNNEIELEERTNVEDNVANNLNNENKIEENNTTNDSKIETDVINEEIKLQKITVRRLKKIMSN